MLARRLVIVSVALVLGTLSARAQQGVEYDACMDKAEGVSTKMLDCGKAAIEQWDTRLNTAYQALLAKSKGEAHAQLQTEQRAWLKHHLSETHRLAADPNNGSVAFLDSQAFELKDITDRTLLLEKRANASR
ncbi:lysozyme inhibitor LprI family protein [Bradyrhizobium quebecense]|uniref:Lysozyme inhibitor LprI family protein n=2 Tax=Bradyrhizobium quebecense TaxID=2748629 RepID=A0ACD3V8T4_9BRAD|nr:lysozyme inhibitor LprI family protein [Bradyrhizobium quebecense]UGY02779.1 lysozyme inhibitor LprI family protein [Bradyrhizobium quebecense]